MLNAHVSHIMPFTLGSLSSDTEVSAYFILVFQISKYKLLGEEKKSDTWMTMFALSRLGKCNKTGVDQGHSLMVLSGLLNNVFGSLELALESTVGAWSKAVG